MLKWTVAIISLTILLLVVFVLKPGYYFTSCTCNTKFFITKPTVDCAMECNPKTSTPVPIPTPKSSPSPTPITTITPVTYHYSINAPANWKKYKGKNGFSFYYPGDWVLKDSDPYVPTLVSISKVDTTQNKVLEMDLSETPAEYIISIKKLDNPHKLTAREYYYTLNGKRQVGDITIGSKTGVIFDEPRSGYGGPDKTIYLSYNAGIIKISYSSVVVDDTRSKYYKTFEQFLTTLNFNP